MRASFRNAREHFFMKGGTGHLNFFDLYTNAYVAENWSVGKFRSQDAKLFLSQSNKGYLQNGARLVVKFEMLLVYICHKTTAKQFQMITFHLICFNLLCSIFLYLFLFKKRRLPCVWATLTHYCNFRGNNLNRLC